MLLPSLKSGFTRFYIIRHGQTEWNVAKRMQGHKDSPLTPQGIAQAEQRALTLKDVPFDEIFSSDLFRAQHTAQIIALDRQIALKTSQLLREGTLGKYEGKTITEFRTELQDMIQKRDTLSEREQFSFKISDDIESYEEIARRLNRFIREAAIAYPGKTLGVVSHAGVLRSFLIQLAFGSEKSLPHGSISNLAYFVLDSNGIEFEVRTTEGITVEDKAP
jgi:broad specificity phosphatase PhoE